MTIMGPKEALTFFKDKDINDYYIGAVPTKEGESDQIRIQKKGFSGTLLGRKILKTWLGQKVSRLFGHHAKFNISTFEKAATILVNAKEGLSDEEELKQVQTKVLVYAKDKFKGVHLDVSGRISNSRPLKSRYRDVQNLTVGQNILTFPTNENYCLPEREGFSSCIKATGAFRLNNRDDTPYYHANLISGNGQVLYIAAQFPFESEDGLNREYFVNMCWSCETDLIIDLSNEEDYKNDPKKLNLYFPEKLNETVKIGPFFEVTCIEAGPTQSSNTKEAKNVRQLYKYEIVQRGYQEKKVISRIHERTWRDRQEFNLKDLISLEEDIQSYKTPHSPPVVHCIKGFGRTGSTIMSDFIYTSIEDKTINIDNYLDKIDEFIIAFRLQRGPSFVQNIKQYEMLVHYTEILLGVDCIKTMLQTGEINKENYSAKIKTFVSSSKFQGDSVIGKLLDYAKTELNITIEDEKDDLPLEKEGDNGDDKTFAYDFKVEKEAGKAFHEAQKTLKASKAESAETLSIQLENLPSVTFLQAPITENINSFWEKCLNPDLTHGRLIVDLSYSKEVENNYCPIKEDEECSVKYTIKEDEQQKEVVASLKCVSVEETDCETIVYDYEYSIGEGEAEETQIRRIYFKGPSPEQLVQTISQVKGFVEDAESLPFIFIHGNEKSDSEAREAIDLNYFAFLSLIAFQESDIENQDNLKEVIISTYQIWIQQGGADFMKSKDFKIIWALSLDLIKELKK
jgi:protein tyrosine phosphatase